MHESNVHWRLFGAIGILAGVVACGSDPIAVDDGATDRATGFGEACNENADCCSSNCTMAGLCGV